MIDLDEQFGPIVGASLRKRFSEGYDWKHDVVPADMFVKRTLIINGKKRTVLMGAGIVRTRKRKVA
jgi:hypothetical protein